MISCLENGCQPAFPVWLAEIDLLRREVSLDNGARGCFLRALCKLGESRMHAEVKSISPSQAWEIMQENHRVVLIDVRSSMEYLFVGHPQGSVHVPWIDEPEWTVNPEFVKEVRKLMLGGVGLEEHTTDAPVILICRSGKRSLEAGKLLIESDFQDVYNIDEGFEGELDELHHRSTVGGWRYRGLPWEQC